MSSPFWSRYAPVKGAEEGDSICSKAGCALAVDCQSCDRVYEPCALMYASQLAIQQLLKAAEQLRQDPCIGHLLRQGLNHSHCCYPANISAWSHAQDQQNLEHHIACKTLMQAMQTVVQQAVVISNGQIADEQTCHKCNVEMFTWRQMCPHAYMCLFR